MGETELSTTLADLTETKKAYEESYAEIESSLKASVQKTEEVRRDMRAATNNLDLQIVSLQDQRSDLAKPFYAKLKELEHDRYVAQQKLADLRYRYEQQIIKSEKVKEQSVSLDLLKRAPENNIEAAAFFKCKIWPDGEIVACGTVKIAKLQKYTVYKCQSYGHIAYAAWDKTGLVGWFMKVSYRVSRRVAEGQIRGKPFIVVMSLNPTKDWAEAIIASETKKVK